MKVNCMKRIEEDIEFLGVTLLSVEEAEILPENIRSIDDWWWLRSPGCTQSYAVYVYDDGSVTCSGYPVDYDNVFVRPALILNLKSTDLTVDDKISFGGYDFTIVSDKYALCDSFIGKCCFRKYWKASDANDYEKSDVKKYVDEWFDNESKKCRQGGNK